MHAIVALAAAHRSRFSPGENEKATSAKSYDSFSLTQYNKAIKSLNAHMTVTNVESIRVAIVSSIVFVCLDMLRGEYSSMNMHFQHGIRLLNFLQPNTQRSRRIRHIYVQPNPHTTDEHLVHAFARLHLQFMTLGSGLFDDDALFTPAFVYGDQQTFIPRVFSVIQEARRSLDQTLSKVIQLLLKFAADHLASAAHLLPISAASLKQQNTLQSTLQDWIVAFDDPMSFQMIRSTRYGDLALRVLRVHWTMATILLSTCFATKETAFDSHTSSFQSIIDQVEELGAVVANTPQHMAPTEDSYVSSFRHIGASFSIDLGCYPPLYFTALKCRVSRIRRRAISILQQCRHTEGVWTGPLLARLATCVVDAEELDFSATLSSDNQDTHDDERKVNETKPSFILPEYSRFYCVHCVLPKGSRNWTFPYGSADLNTKNPTPNTWSIGSLICHRFRHELGKDGYWVTKSYDIDFNL